MNCATTLLILSLSIPAGPKGSCGNEIGREVSVPEHLEDGEEFKISLEKLIEHGEHLFTANWTAQEGGGRPLAKGTGAPLSDPGDPLVFPRNFNRLSGPDANSCAGCHNAPYGIPGGGGDIVANVFVLAQRFDFATFNPEETTRLKGCVDEGGLTVTLPTIANSRNTLGMFGSGFIEMLARQITADLQEIRDAVPPGGASELTSKGISFGYLARDAAGAWDTSGVEGLPPQSLLTGGPDRPPSLLILPFHQSGSAVSLRVFTNNAFNHHHGIQSTERFGVDTDPDGDGFTNELTRADVTAAVVFQATMAVPGQVLPEDRDARRAVKHGEDRFRDIGCASCHIPALPLTNRGWIFTEPNPYNPAGNLRVGEARTLKVDLTDHRLPSPRLRREKGVVWVPAFTDLKLHDITSGPDDPNVEELNMNRPAGSPAFFSGNSYYLTRKLWGSANEFPYYHHGKYTTLRDSVLAHAGEAAASTRAFRSLSTYDQDSIIEFLKSLQVLSPRREK